MCKEGYMLRISNRGDGIREIVKNTTYQVNVPIQLRGKQVNIELVSGLIVLDTDKANFENIKEVGVVSDIGIRGFDTESSYSSNQFQSQGFSTLFDVSLQNFDTTTNKSRVSFHTNEKYSFQIGSMPEKFTFSTYKVSEDEPSLTDMTSGQYYKILTVGTTNFTSLGANSNAEGEVFKYNGASTSGSGTVLELSTKHLFNNPYYCSFILKVMEQ